MRLRHIEVFHAIYTTGSITNAAKALHVSQPSVSKVLSHAEMQLGFKLFERVKGRLIPTEEASMLFNEVDKIYQQMRSIKNTAENIKKAEFGNINLSVTPALGFDALPCAIAKYHRKYPKVNFNVQTIHNNEALQALLEHKCDLAVVFSPSAMPGVKAIKIAQSELVAVFPRNLFPLIPAHLTFQELEGAEFIDISDSGPLGHILWKRMLAENVVLDSTIKVQTYFIAARLVAQGVGVCIVDKYTAIGNLSDDIAIASFSPPLLFNVSALHLENKALSHVLDTFINELSHCI